MNSHARFVGTFFIPGPIVRRSIFVVFNAAKCSQSLEQYQTFILCSLIYKVSYFLFISIKMIKHLREVVYQSGLAIKSHDEPCGDRRRRRLGTRLDQ